MPKKMTTYMAEVLKNVRLDDVPEVSRYGGAYPWRVFAEKFGVEALVWLSAKHGSGMLYVPGIDQLTRKARARAIENEGHLVD
tara:strand:- start:714 stop:962 length:249 start_codon:yes stop_codon:yes gene_type:complete